MLQESYQVLDKLRKPHGLYIASPSNFYKYVWIRDNVYISLPFVNKDNEWYEKTYYRMLDLFREYEWKLDILLENKPKWVWEYIHARYSADEVKEIHDEAWGHVQHDMIGAFLFGIGLGIQHDKGMIRDQKDLDILQKLVYYLENVEYWHDPDNGMWEEWREIHASSLGACLAGLNSIDEFVDVPSKLIGNGFKSLFELYPRESPDKSVDLAQLSLVYPYRIINGLKGEFIVSRVEESLLRENGVIRYAGDSYYSTLEQKHGREKPREFYKGSEAEWCFGLPWLALCHLELGHIEKASEYVQKTEEIMIKPGVLPELYYSGTRTPNPNTPLGWGCSMYILAKEALVKKTVHV
ncbi:glycoside hydrolase family 15 protein [Chengkuizengella sp. SCS-71B]|uniref:glycoside hydrolase family 15 protein n=1 Tax=Chengkuizengella sp. SCS-71B TaxID=3115290 RepID=UPI0032C22F82